MLQPLSGYVLDSIGLKVGFAPFATAWSLLTMAHSPGGQLVALPALRGALGVGREQAAPSRPG